MKGLTMYRLFIAVAAGLLLITAAHAKPNPSWLNFVVTAKARSRIRHFLKTMHFQESAQLGERLLNQALTALGSALGEIKDTQWE